MIFGAVEEIAAEKIMRYVSRVLRLRAPTR